MRSRRARVLVACVLVALVASGCTSARRQAQGTGAGGGTLVVGTLADLAPATIYSQSTTSMTIGGLVYDTLVEKDRRTGRIRPSVARAWQISDDGLTVRLTLRDDVRFHDGRPLTSRDVAYAIAKYASPEAASQLQATAAAVRTVDTSDPQVAVLRLRRPLANLFDLLEFMLLTDRRTEKQLLAGTQFNGTGPFEFREWKRGQVSTFVRHRGYWGGDARLDEVRVQVVPDQTALLNAVRSRQVDVVPDAPPEALAAFRADPDSYTVRPSDVYDVAYYLGVNVRSGPLREVRLRQAMSWAVDRARIRHDVFRDVGQVNVTPWSPSSVAYDASAARLVDHDPDRARRLVRAAGGAPDRPLTLSYNAGLGASKAVASIVQNDLSVAGLRVQLQPLDGPALTERINAGQTDLWVNPHGFGQSSPATLVTGAAPFKPVGNLSGYEAEAYRRAVAAVSAQADPTSSAARRAYAALSRQLIVHAFAIDLVTTTVTNVYASSVRGVRWNLYKNLQLDDATVR